MIRKLMFVLALLCFIQTARAQFPQTVSEQQELFLLAPRSLLRLLEEGETAINEKRYAEGVKSLVAILLDEDDSSDDFRGQDFFLEVGSRGLFQRSIKGEAIRILGELPPEGRNSLELQFGVTARQLLNEAMNAGDFESIAEVARKYVHTEAGYDASLLIAQQQVTQGYPLAAAGVLQTLLGSGPARDRYGVRLAEAATNAWLQAEKISLAVSTLESATKLFSGQSVMLQGRQVQLDAATDWNKLLANAAASQTVSSVGRETSSWKVAGGSPQRNAISSAGMPLSNARWVKEIRSSDPEQRMLIAEEQNARKAGNFPLPKFELRILNDVVLTKRTDATIIAIDFDTGNLVWDYSVDGKSVPLKSLFGPLNYEPSDGISNELQTRVWGSSAFGRFSCDDDCLYAVSAAKSDDSTPRTRLQFNANATNLLDCVSIRSEGKVLWQIGGVTGEDEPELAGAYFLGPPLPYEGTLYSLIEVNGETRVIAIDPADGDLLWSQQLVHAESQPIAFDTLRQNVALSPTISEGILVCPTGTGGVVAIDLLTRSLKWGTTYRTSNFGFQNNFRGGGFGSMERDGFDPLARRWEEDMIIADGSMLVSTPTNSDYFYLWDVLTGEPNIPPHQRRTGRYIAGLHNGLVIIVGENVAVGFDPKQKRNAWECEFPQAKTLVGKGLRQAEHILVPLTENTLIQIRLSDGEIVDQTVVDEPLGNLFAYRDQLLSVSSTAVAAYYTRESLADSVEVALKKNPNDVWALNQQSQLEVAKGNIEEAMNLLQKAYQLQSDDPETTYLLIETLLTALDKDFLKYEALADQLDVVVPGGPQRFRYLQQLALGKISHQKHFGAFDRVYELMRDRLDEAASGARQSSYKIQVERGYSVDSDVWIASQLSRLYEQADAGEREQMNKLIESEIETCRQLSTVNALRRLSYLNWLPQVGDLRQSLASSLIATGQVTAAEQLLQPLLWNRENDAYTKTVGLLHESLHQSEAKKIKQHLSALDRNASPWKAGEMLGESGNAYLFNVGKSIQTIGDSYGAPPISLALSIKNLIVIDGYGNRIANFDYPQATGDHASHFQHAYLRGGLLLFETASEIAAFDVYRGLEDESNALLWRHSLVGASPREPFASASVSRLGEVLGISLHQHQPLNGADAAIVGPITANCVVLRNKGTVLGLDPLSGNVLWSRDGYSGDVRFATDGLRIAIVRAGKGQVDICDSRDGQLLETREQTGLWQHWFSCGEVMVDFTKQTRSARASIRIWNAMSGKTAHEINLPLAARTASCENRFLAIVDPSNVLQVFDLHNGTQKEYSLSIDRDVSDLIFERFDDKLVLLGNVFSNSMRTSQNSPTDREVNGQLFVFDATSLDLLWTPPGRLRNMTYPTAQPRNSPYLTVYRYISPEVEPTESESITEPTISFAVIDLRDGHVAYSVKDKAVRTRNFVMRLEPSTNEVLLTVGSDNYVLKVQDDPGKNPRTIVDFGDKAAESGEAERPDTAAGPDESSDE